MGAPSALSRGPARIGLRRPAPDPQPNVAGWLTRHALAGLENHLDANNPYKEGSGAQLKLRSLQADQVARFLSTLRQVNLVVDRLYLQDRDGNGRWDMEIYVEVPGS